MGATDNVGVLARIFESIIKRPFTEMSAIVSTLAIISFAVYEVGWGRRELIDQIHGGQQAARDQFDKRLELTISQLNSSNEREVDSMQTMVRDLVGQIRASHSSAGAAKVRGPGLDGDEGELE